MKALRHAATYLPLIVIGMVIVLSFWRHEYRRDTGPTDQTPDLTLLVLLDRMRMTDLAGIKDFTSPQAFEVIEGVCRNPDFTQTSLYALALKNGLRGNQLQDPLLVWQKWAEAMDDNEVKWLRHNSSSTQKYPVFKKDDSATFVFEQQRDGSWQIIEVTLSAV